MTFEFLNFSGECIEKRFLLWPSITTIALQGTCGAFQLAYARTIECVRYSDGRNRSLVANLPDDELYFQRQPLSAGFQVRLVQSSVCHGTRRRATVRVKWYSLLD
jgi:hypothetical protein